MLPRCWPMRKHAYKIFDFWAEKRPPMVRDGLFGEGVILGLLAIADNCSRAALEITHGFRRLTNTRAYRAPVWR